jgi:hypothetical protein
VIADRVSSGHGLQGASRARHNGCDRDRLDGRSRRRALRGAAGRISEVNGLNWGWIALEATAPPIVGLLFAWPFWRKAQPIFGNLAGTAVIFGSAFALILREQIELDRLMQQCVDAGYLCFPNPAAFTRFAIYASIALVEVFGLFYLSLRVDERRRRRGYAPEWR